MILGNVSCFSSVPELLLGHVHRQAPTSLSWCSLTKGGGLEGREGGEVQQGQSHAQDTGTPRFSESSLHG